MRRESWPNRLWLVCSLLAFDMAALDAAAAAPLSDPRFAPALREASSPARGALAAATADSRVVALVPDADRRLVAIDLIEEKVDGGRDSRAEQLRAIVAGRRSAAAVTFDADSGRIVRVERFDPLRAPFDEVDLQRATALALQDPQVREFLGARAGRFMPQLTAAQDGRPFMVQMLPVRGILPTDPCTRARCVDLIFRAERGYLTGRRVTVDLTNDRVQVTGSRVSRHD
jgi:hypothetical protein